MIDNHTPALGPRFEGAFLLASKLHARQIRKTNGVPYLSHLLSVTALVLQDGGNEDEAIAALLHDAPEDQGGEETLALIREQFGANVAQIVEECSDTFAVPKPPWRARKQAHIIRLKSASPSIHRVMLADKLHNSRALLRQLRLDGQAAWGNFKGGKRGTLWYLQTMRQVLGEHNQGYLWEEFGRTLEEIERLTEKD